MSLIMRIEIRLDETPELMAEIHKLGEIEDPEERQDQFCILARRVFPTDPQDVIVKTVDHHEDE